MLSQCFPSIVARLRAAGCVFAEDEAALLTAEARDAEDLRAMVRRRIRGLPLEQVLGWASFCGLRIAIDPRVFVPRRRTQFLARTAISLAGARAAPIVVDLCCGSGAVGAAVLARVPDVQLHAADIDARAVVCARRNLAPAPVTQGDLFEALPQALRGRIDVLVANPPYVPSSAIELLPPEARIYEPVTSLDGGADGLDVAARVARDAQRWLARSGCLLIETSEYQADQLVEAFRGGGLRATVLRCVDLDATVVVGAREEDDWRQVERE
jgi:release factor glutamine methyltransferase